MSLEHILVTKKIRCASKMRAFQNDIGANLRASIASTGTILWNKSVTGEWL